MTWNPLTHMQPTEKHVKTLRRHWMVIAGLLFMGIVLCAAPVGVFFLLRFATPEWFDQEIPQAILKVVLAAYGLAVWLFLTQEFIDFYLDTWVITTGRVINAEQRGMFRRVNAELNLSSVQDVTSEIRGPVQTFFHFGTVRIQTAGTSPNFVLKQIPHPEEVKEMIMRLAEADRLREGAH